jgi:hypothetical protein
MATLYKYLPNLGIEFFEQPTFKISPPSLLNDPFEFSFSSEIKIAYRNYLRKKLPNSFVVEEEKINHYLNHALNSIGIISLTETHRSLLMWAHYADEHRGFCIGVDEDYLENINNIEPNNNVIPIQNRPIKIKYDTKRFDLDINHPSFSNVLKALIMNQLTVKSDEWIYEKEYRSIVYLLNHDNIVFKGGIPRDVHIAMGFMKTINIDTQEEAEADRSHSALNIAMSALAKHKEVIFLKNIPHEKIKSVYFGHRFDKYDLREIIKNAKKEDHPLHKAKIYKYKIHPSRFELTPKLLHSNY